MPRSLSAEDAVLLAFEESLPIHSGAKEEAIRHGLRLSVAGYYLRLSRLIDTEAALAHDAVLVARLRRVRDHRRAARAQRTRSSAL